MYDSEPAIQVEAALHGDDHDLVGDDLGLYKQKIVLYRTSWISPSTIYTVSRCFCSTENMKGKVVLITGASSGIGEQLPFKYAKKEASLVIVARREKRLVGVAERARGLGSPDVLPVCADVSNVNDCKRFVDGAINHFGQCTCIYIIKFIVNHYLIYSITHRFIFRMEKITLVNGLDLIQIGLFTVGHVVNNAGISCVCTTEDATDITKFTSMMDINFWGSIYTTHFAIPQLKKTKGKTVVNSSAAALLNSPGLSLYSASKAALISYHETLRVELGSEITITITTLGFIESEITQGKCLSKEGVIEVNTKLMRDTRSTDVIQAMPAMSCSACAKVIVNGVCRGERNVTQPKWFKLLFMLRTLSPEVVEWYYRTFYFTNPTISHQMLSANISSTSPAVTKTKAN
ncbi:11-beta-hydroxysteroid dehydrogenase 1A-like [Cornus florida]|uniref:11-beta-hydroxysteroid dehydrogenase 1A-like n=1 Tax=Cornus florida TaxID=4283 RepID=UPI00289745E2|nr:11-beta-hydroxysteroid dehydrogenase 1A-like [Cornus florida]